MESLNSSYLNTTNIINIPTKKVEHVSELACIYGKLGIQDYYFQQRLGRFLDKFLFQIDFGLEDISD